MIAQANVNWMPLATNSVDMIFTDPPYLLEYLDTYEWLANEAVRVLKPGGFVLAMCGGSYLNEIFRMFDASGLRYYWLYQNGMTGHRAGVVWKHSDVGNKPISIRSKSIIAYYKPNPAESYGRATSRTATASWYDGNGKSKIHHVWGQDVESARYYIDCFTDAGDLVCDPFAGGGTTMAAADEIGRRCVAFDIDLAACVTTKWRIEHEHAYLQNLPIFK